MKIIKVKGTNKDFIFLAERLLSFQQDLLPVLKGTDYNLTDDLDDIVGYILYIDGKPVGSIGVRKVDDETCEIVRVFVDENYRDNGYAVLLFKKIEKLAKNMGFKRAEMFTWAESKSAIKLYTKLGYTISEEKVSEWFKGLRYVEIYKYL